MGRSTLEDSPDTMPATASEARSSEAASLTTPAQLVMAPCSVRRCASALASLSGTVLIRQFETSAEPAPHAHAGTRRTGIGVTCADPRARSIDTQAP